MLVGPRKAATLALGEASRGWSEVERQGAVEVEAGNEVLFPVAGPLRSWGGGREPSVCRDLKVW